jgi:hypothetical protein
MTLGERDARRELCDELAERLAGDGGLRLARLLQLAGLLKTPPFVAPAAIATPARSDAADPRRPRPISIWQPVERDGRTAWQRPEPSPLGDHYAARRLIEPRREDGPRRVVFFGESVAAGYLYAPAYTPARVLEAQLSAGGQSPGWEVIDLARTNERLASMVDTFEASLQLAPDVAVFFAGNNWALLETPELSPWAPRARHRQRFGLALRSGGPTGPVELAERQLARRVRAAFARMAALAAAAGVRMVVVEPEVNLADWPARQPLCWAAEARPQRMQRWYGALERAERLLDGGDLDRLAREAGRLATIDAEPEGAPANPTPLFLRAELLARQGDRAGAARAARAGVDADTYPLAAFLPSPRITSQARSLLRAAVAEHGFAHVDLPARFAEHCGDPLPGRRMFLDYCHLTQEGIAVAMASTAVAVLSPGQPPAELWRELVSAAPSPSPEVDAVAKLGAAVHTAHRLAGAPIKAELLRYWCRQALAAWPGIGGTMVLLAEVRTAPLPELLTAAQQAALAAPVAFGLQHGWRWSAIDGGLLRAATTEAMHTGGELALNIVTRISLCLEQAARTMRRAPMELAVPGRYLAEPVERFYPEAMALDDLSGRTVLRCVWPRTSFDFPCGHQGALQVCIVARLPPVAATARPGAGSAAAVLAREDIVRAGTVSLRINGEAVESWPLTARWSRRRIELPVEVLRAGLNRLTLRWPMPPEVDRAALAAAGERLENGLDADLQPVFGELYSLRVEPPAAAAGGAVG